MKSVVMIDVFWWTTKIARGSLNLLDVILDQSDVLFWIARDPPASAIWTVEPDARLAHARHLLSVSIVYKREGQTKILRHHQHQIKNKAV